MNRRRLRQTSQEITMHPPSDRAAPASDLPVGPEYTCPMHPEVVQRGPAPARSAAWRWSRVVVTLEDDRTPSSTT